MRLLLTAADLDDMPDEPVGRFLAIYELTTDRYEAQLERMEAENNWGNNDGLRRQYASVLSASAKRLGIDEVASLRLPSAKDSDGFDEFMYEVDHYVLQLMHDSSLAKSLTSIELRGDIKARLRTLSQHMRDHISRMELSDRRKDALLRRIDEFDRELEKRRMALTTAAILAVHIIVGVKEVGEDGTQLIALGQKVMAAFAHEKDDQDKERFERLPNYQEKLPLQLTGTGTLTEVKVARRETFSADLDDEIPF